MTNVKLETVTADSGYCSEKNLAFCRDNQIEAFIKLNSHETQKTRKYQNNIGKHYNMKRVSVGNEYQYICHNKKIYRSKSCKGCLFKDRCFYNYNEEKHKNANKKMRINHNWEELKLAANNNIHSEQGIYERQVRSIQTERILEI